MDPRLSLTFGEKGAEMAKRLAWASPQGCHLAGGCLRRRLPPDDW